MSFIDRNLKEDLTIWSVSSTDIYGNATWSSPIAIKGRWEDKQIKTIDFKGNEIISKAIVYVNTDLTLGDYIYHGVSTASSPPASAYEVRNYSKIPSLKNTKYLRKATL